MVCAFKCHGICCECLILASDFYFFVGQKLFIPFASRCFQSVLVCLLLLSSTCLQAAECKKVRISADPDYPPLHWYDGHNFHGTSITVATRVLKKMGVPYEVQYVGPFARVLLLGEKGQIDMITTLKITPERQQWLSFTEQPTFANPIAAFTLIPKMFPYMEWANLKGKRGGVTRGNRFGEPFDTYAQQYLELEEGNSLDQNFKKLEWERIDYFITGYYAGMAYVRANRLEKKIAVLDPFILSKDNYIAFVKSSPCAALLPRFNREMVKWLRQHQVKELLEASGKEWLSSQ